MAVEESMQTNTPPGSSCSLYVSSPHSHLNSSCPHRKILLILSQESLPHTHTHYFPPHLIRWRRSLQIRSVTIAVVAQTPSRVKEPSRGICETTQTRSQLPTTVQFASIHSLTRLVLKSIQLTAGTPRAQTIPKSITAVGVIQSFPHSANMIGIESLVSPAVTHITRKTGSEVRVQDSTTSTSPNWFLETQFAWSLAATPRVIEAI